MNLKELSAAVNAQKILREHARENVESALEVERKVVRVLRSLEMDYAEAYGKMALAERTK